MNKYYFLTELVHAWYVSDKVGSSQTELMVFVYPSL